jgi:CO/xanthine dehydrogenase Mo-binding subunit
MSDERLFDDGLEPERYELRAGAAYAFDVDRRDFIRTLGGGLAVLLVATRAVAQESGGGRRGQPGNDALPSDVAAWLHVDEKGVITAFTGKTEIGQNIRTSLTQAVAEELRAPVHSITLVMADTAKTPYDMGTFGSRTTPTMNAQLRRVAAAAREMLIDLAAERWQTDRASLQASDGKVSDGARARSASYGELTRGQRLVRTIDDRAVTTPPSQWKIAGTPVPKVNGREIVTGRHRYTTDLHPTGLVYGKVVRPAAYGATLRAVDTSGADKLAGVTVVRDGEFIGVTAADPAVAAAAAAAIRADWNTTPQPSARELFAYLKANPEGASGRGGNSAQTAGQLDAALAASDVTLERRYTIAYIAHAPLEPRAAVAEWTNDGLTVWTGTQRPFGVRAELMEAFHLPAERVRVIVPDTGSAYGGKHSGETAIEAARLAKAAGKPVKLVWTREEEFAWAYFRPAGVIDVKSGARKDGTLTAWDFHNYNSGSAGIATPYAVANRRVQFHPTKSPLRQGSYRGLAATANHFAREVHMDELASAVGMDPVAFRRRNLSDARLRAVVDAAVDRFGWEKSRADRNGTRGAGVACGVEKGGYTATCAAVAVDRGTGQVKVLRLVTAFECGAIVNPDGLRNQIEGAVVQGLGGALFEAIEFESGRLTNGRFSQYRVPRFSDVPALETVLLDRRDVPSAGAGETPIVGVAPAIANAIFDASGTRLRALPLVPSGQARATDER